MKGLSGWSRKFLGILGSSLFLSSCLNVTPVWLSLTPASTAPGAAAKLLFATLPSNGTVVSTVFNPSPVVQVLDSKSRIVSGTNLITLSAFSDSSCTIPSGGVLTASTNPLSSVAGSVSFSGVSYSTAETIHLGASSPGLQSACSNPVLINVSPDTPVLMITGHSFAFNSPGGIAVDSSGNIYVTDSNNERVQVSFPDGTFSFQFGIYGSGSGQFSTPTGIAVGGASGSIYVSDDGNFRIQVFQGTGTYSNSWGSSGSGIGQFNNALGLAVDSSENVYVSDTNNSRIQVFQSNGTYTTSWGTSGSGTGQFNHPVGIAIDSLGLVYVVDSYNDRVQVFDDTGTYLSNWGSAGSGDGQFSHPGGIAVTSSGYVYVTDSSNNRVQVFDTNGNYLAQWGNGSLFNNPSGVAVDTSGGVYVMDTGNLRILKFNRGSNP